MPRLTGREATKKIREFESTVGSSGGGRRVPIIGLSGNARRQQIDDAKEVCGRIFWIGIGMRSPELTSKSRVAWMITCRNL